MHVAYHQYHKDFVIVVTNIGISQVMLHRNHKVKYKGKQVSVTLGEWEVLRNPEALWDSTLTSLDLNEFPSQYQGIAAVGPALPFPTVIEHHPTTVIPSTTGHQEAGITPVPMFSSSSAPSAFNPDSSYTAAGEKAVYI